MAPRTVGRVLLALATAPVGVDHFVHTARYAMIVPPPLPAWPAVYVSGVFEILGSIGLFVPATRRFSALGLVALYIAVFPANVYQAVAQIPVPGMITEPWMMWARLPFQALLIGTAWWVRQDPPDLQSVRISS